MSHSPPKPWRSLRQRRKNAGLSTTELAELAGYSKSYIGHLEHGIRKPNPRNIRRLADALGVKPEDLRVDYALNPDAPEVIEQLQNEVAALTERLAQLAQYRNNTITQGAA